MDPDEITELSVRGADHGRAHDLGAARQLLTAALDEARVHLDTALIVVLEPGARTDEAYVHEELGFLLLDEKPNLALDRFHAALALAPGATIVNLAGNALSGTGVALLQLGRAAEVVPFLLGALTIRAEIGDLEQQHVDLVHLASAAFALGDPTTAARLARFLDGDPDNSKGMDGQDRRSLRAVLHATAGSDAVPAERFDEARQLTAAIGAAPKSQAAEPKSVPSG